MKGKNKGYGWAISAGANAHGFSCYLCKVPFHYRNKRGYGWAISAGANAALAAISAKYFSTLVIKYGMVIFFNIVMWGCYVNSLRALSSLQATVTNFATNFLSSGLAGFFLFGESLSFKWFVGASLIVIGVLVLSKSSKEAKTNTE